MRSVSFPTHDDAHSSIVFQPFKKARHHHSHGGAIYLLQDLLLSKKRAVAQPRSPPPPQDGAQPAFEKGVRGCAQRHSRKRGGFHTTTITTTTIRPTYTHTQLYPSLPLLQDLISTCIPISDGYMHSFLLSYHPMSRVFKGVTISFSTRVTT